MHIFPIVVSALPVKTPTHNAWADIPPLVVSEERRNSKQRYQQTVEGQDLIIHRTVALLKSLTKRHSLYKCIWIKMSVCSWISSQPTQYINSNSPSMFQQGCTLIIHVTNYSLFHCIQTFHNVSKIDLFLFVMPCTFIPCIYINCRTYIRSLNVTFSMSALELMHTARFFIISSLIKWGSPIVST